jgi:asparagine synthase (glutamine-hydrolysing)
MCGIAGLFQPELNEAKGAAYVQRAVNALARRGPDGNGVFAASGIALGHTRLAVIDTSDAAAQPFRDSSGRYTIVFNGEIFNYRELREQLIAQGYKFRTGSDTEVLLTLYITQGEKMLRQLNGFFAFGVWDNEKQELFLARDRYGEKPLYFSRQPGTFYFASEIKGLLAMGVPKILDYVTLSLYLHLNYVPPGNWSMLKYVQPLAPGTFARIGTNLEPIHTRWYTLPENDSNVQYDDAKTKLAALTEAAVQRRLVSDVPLGAFLSGGVDSSIIAALAAKHTSKLHTFSIGFADEPLFDETAHARQTAKHIGTEHTVFMLRNADLLEHLEETLDYMDEPFADSSALAVSILSRKTRDHITVALSGDGADELFAGYNKHRAAWLAMYGGLRSQLVKAGNPLWQMLPASRNSKSGNRIRQLRRFAEGMKLDTDDRYWRWAGYTNQGKEDNLLFDKHLFNTKYDQPWDRIHELKAPLRNRTGMNVQLYCDMQMVLGGDMLVKVDRMSMCHGLEVRSPFLDHELVDFVMQLPASYKIDATQQKKILKETFATLLPAETFSRRKQGFEVPLLHWFRNELRSTIHTLLAPEHIKAQGIFRPEKVAELLRQLDSASPGDAVARVWALVVFQHWWNKYMN